MSRNTERKNKVSIMGEVINVEDDYFPTLPGQVFVFVCV